MGSASTRLVGLDCVRKVAEHEARRASRGSCILPWLLLQFLLELQPDSLTDAM